MRKDEHHFTAQAANWKISSHQKHCAVVNSTEKSAPAHADYRFAVTKSRSKRVLRDRRAQHGFNSVNTFQARHWLSKVKFIASGQLCPGHPQRDQSGMTLLADWSWRDEKGDNQKYKQKSDRDPAEERNAQLFVKLNNDNDLRWRVFAESEREFVWRFVQTVILTFFYSKLFDKNRRTLERVTLPAKTPSNGLRCAMLVSLRGSSFSYCRALLSRKAISLALWHVTMGDDDR